MFFIGIDVSKAKLDCCLLLDSTSHKRRAKVVANSKTGVADLLAWCAKQQVAVHELHAVMEGTGVYNEHAALALADAGAVVSIVNPAQVKDFGRSLGVRTKNDGVDSVVLARYGALLNPRPWTPPAHEARVLQALLSRREAVAQDLQRERNRLEKADATDTPALIRQSIADSISFLKKQLAKLQQDIDDHINQHPSLKEDRDLLTSILSGRAASGQPVVVGHAQPRFPIRRTVGGLSRLGAGGTPVRLVHPRPSPPVEGGSGKDPGGFIHGRHCRHQT